jgi:transposase
MTMTSVDALPDDAESLKRLLLARDEELAVARAHAATVAAEAASLRARAADDQTLIARLKLQIEKLRRERFGQRSERSSRLLDQLELQLEELEASATEDELAAERAAAKTTKVAAFTRQRPARKPFPEHLPRERSTPVEVGRRYHRDPRGHPPSVEGDPACAREVLVPRLREHQPGGR